MVEGVVVFVTRMILIGVIEAEIVVSQLLVLNVANGRIAMSKVQLPVQVDNVRVVSGG